MARPKPQEGNAKTNTLISIAALIFKLLKSAKAVQAALVGASFASWSLLFNLKMAAIIMVSLVIHEYGHLRAMKKFGIPTKGIYLIPFVGGVAVGDRASSQWQDVYISIMGPVYGLFMSVAFLVAYLIFDSMLFANVAAFSALLNLFNLLPIYPLDGGRILRALAESSQRFWGMIGVLVFSAVAFYCSWRIGLSLLSFFIVIGAFELISDLSGKQPHKKPLNAYGIILSLLWYVSVVVIFVGMMLWLDGQDVPAAKITRIILQS